MSRADLFTLPAEATAFIDNVYYRADQLVKARIWTGLSQARLRMWRKNFRDDLEAYFGACILDSLIYRTDAQTEALARHLWHAKLPRVISSMATAPPTASEDLASIFDHSSKSRPVVVVPVVSQSDLAKSGHVVVRLLQQKLQVSKGSVLPIDTVVNKPPRIVVFVDDFLGSGSQFARFAQRYKLNQLMLSTCCIYAPLVAHSVGTRLLRRCYPRLTIVPCEQLTAAHSVFSSASATFRDGVNSPAGARQFYLRLRRTRGIPLGWSRGQSDPLATAYAFEHATPNNNIEILWTRQSPDWVPLFDR